MSLMAELTGALYHCKQALPLQLGTWAKLRSLLRALEFIAEVNGTYSGLCVPEYNTCSV